MNIYSISLLLISFILISAVINSALKVTVLGSVFSRGLRLGFSLGFGPLLLSFLLTSLFFFLPGLSKISYILIVIVFLVVCFYLTENKKIQATPSENCLGVSDFSSGFGKPIDVLLVILIVVSLLILFLSVLTIPLYSNDPLEYFKTAEVLAHEVDLFFYPVSDVTVGNGFYGPWTHPPGYAGMLVWGVFIDSFFDTSAPGSGRFIGWYYCVASLFLLLAWTKNQGLVACLFFIAAPIYFAGVSSSHIDAPRVFPILATFVIFQQALIDTSAFKTNGFIVLSAVSLACCFFLHSIGMIIAPLWGLLVLVLYPGSLFQKAFRGGLVFLLLALLVAPFLYSNYQTLGRVLSDTPEVWALDEIRHTDFIAAQRNLGSGTKKVTNGILKGWFKLRSFGLMYWAAIIGIFLFILKVIRQRQKKYHKFINEHSLEITSVGVVLVYFGMAVVATLLGSDAFIKNDRYFLTIHPFVAFLGAVGASWLIRRLFHD